MNDNFNDPFNVEAWPPTLVAADGKTTLYRFDVDAIVYAPDREAARHRVEESSIYYEAARLRGSDEETS